MKTNYDKEDGRSMIEMLGVLAIIGVLSVGGIAGYSKAMHRYRVNKTIDQITYMAGAIRSFFAPQRDYNGLTNNDLLKKAKLVPDDMWESGKTNPQHVWGGEVEVRSYVNKGFELRYTNVQEEACIDLVTQDWSAANVGAIIIGNRESSLAESNVPTFIPPVDIDAAVKACQTEEGIVNFIDFNFDGMDAELEQMIANTTQALDGGG